MKKFLSLILIVFLLIPLVACSGVGDDNGKLKIVVSLFPHYDFVRQIVGDKAEVTLLLQPGTESHTYDPSAVDIYTITSSDIFIYTGKNMEAWAERVISSLGKNGPAVVDTSSGIELIIPDGHDEGEEHEHASDPHIWLNPIYAGKMVDTISDAICKADPDNAEYYKTNATNYKKELVRLDSDIKNAVDVAKGDTLVFGGRFAYIYFFERYDLHYKTAYKTCSTETEPSLTTIYEISQYINDNGISYVFKEELSEGKVAGSISEQTGAQVLTFSTAHNVTKSEFDSGITYIDIMRNNLEAIKKALDY